MAQRWEELRRRMTVDRHLLPVKVWYFVFFAGVAVLLPYLSVFFRSIGLSASEVSIITGLMPFFSFIFRPLFGMLADKINRHKLILMLCCLTNGLVHLCLLLVPAVTPITTTFSVSTNLTCRTEGVHACRSFIDKILHQGNCNTSINGRYDLVRCSVDCGASKNDRICLYEYLENAPSGAGNISTCDRSVDTKSGRFNIGVNIIDNTNFSSTETRVAIEMLENDGELKRASSSLPFQLNETCAKYYLNDLQYISNVYERLTCGDGDNELDCSFKCDNTRCLKFAPELKKNLEKKERYGATFWLTCAIVLIAHTLFSPCSSLTDGIAYDMLDEERRHLWGNQRLWGTIGFGGISAVIGFVIAAYQAGRGTTNDFSLNIYLYASIMVGAMFASSRLRVPKNFHCSKILTNVSRLLKRLHIVCFLCCVFMFGFLYASVIFYMFWHLEDLHAKPLVLSLSIMMTCIGEVPVLFVAGRIIQKLGEIACLYAAKISPPGMSGTLQGLVSGTHFGFGLGIGALVAGLVYERWGGHVLFISEAILAAISLFLFVIVQNCFIKSNDIPTLAHPVDADKRGSSENVPTANETMINNDNRLLENGDPTSGTTDSTVEEQKLTTAETAS
ncbi:major facilitator superfamily domain-containing protein 6-A-like isoform X2 [Tubulanus polymorphus]|uniref:major facilitator superfamily domain-containing protein 6-A-like isoform X2 n=1 Tax=Tubulanus polymorphus TaxID=672921 RepID=UPI003DA588EB